MHLNPTLRSRTTLLLACIVAFVPALAGCPDNDPTDPTVATITVTSPNGGESWLVGSIQDITWTSQGTVGNVDLAYSTDGGTTWTDIATEQPNSGSYAWTIPNDVSTTVTVRVQEPDGDLTDVSDAEFAIESETQPGITVTAPNGGEIWYVDASENITWTTVGTVGNVDLAYSTDGGSTWTDIATDQPNNGTYAWTLPNDPSTTVTVRVEETGTGSPSDVSDADLTIDLVPAIVVTAPNGSETWVVGDNENITWDSYGMVGNVDIAYSADGTTFTDIDTNQPNNGTYAWTIPDNLSGTVTVRVQETGTGAPSDVSDADFAIYTGVWFVNASVSGGTNNGLDWANAFTDLQDALAIAQSGGEIWVAAGTYKPAGPGGSVTATFALVDGVEAYGGFIGTESARTDRNWNTNVTTLSGDLDSDDGGLTVVGNNSEHVVTGADNAVLDGFTIIGGNMPTTDEGGGGMFNNAVSPTVANCTFTGNHAYYGGGMYNLDASPTVTNCLFLKNTTSQSGGAIANQGSLAAPDISYCSFERNSAEFVGGAAMSNYGVANGTTISFSTFYGNSGSAGSGMLNTTSSPTVTNCTFAYNGNFSGAGAAMANGANSSPNITNSIFWGNRGANSTNALQVSGNTGDSPTFTNCCIEGGLATGVSGGSPVDGGGNISSNPDFVGAPAWVDHTQHQGTSSTIEVANGDLYFDQLALIGILSDWYYDLSQTGGTTVEIVGPNLTTTRTRGGQILVVFDGTNGWSMDAHLQSSSQCIGAGTGGLDIGAYEYP